MKRNQFYKALNATLAICTISSCAHVERVALSVAESARSGSRVASVPSDNGTPEARGRALLRTDTHPYAYMTIYANGSAVMQVSGLEAHSCEAELAKAIRDNPQQQGVFVKCETMRLVNALPYSTRVRDNKTGKNNEIRFKNKEMCTNLIGLVSSFGAAINAGNTNSVASCS